MTHSRMQVAVKPNLFVIGAAKSGSTSLHNYLNVHPQIVMSTFKEPRFFLSEEKRHPLVFPKVLPGESPRDVFRRLFPSREPPHTASELGTNHVPAPNEEGVAERLFQCFKPGDRAIDIYLRLFPEHETAVYAGESTPNYTQAPHEAGVAERISQFNPAARLIYIVRDPIERTISNYFYRSAGGQETEGSPLDAIRKNPFYCDTSHYAMQYREYLRFFAPEQIHVMTLEDLTARPAATMAQVFEWLGLDLPQGHSDERYSDRKNATPAAFMQRRSHLPWLIRQSPAFARLRSLIPPSIRQRAWRLLANSPLASRRVVRSEVELTKAIVFLREVQVPQVKEFEELCGQKFPQWRTLWQQSDSASLCN